MRLLEGNNDGEFSLTEHFGDAKPQYAILSHVWGAMNEEVTFKDMIDGTSEAKVGYDKVRFCGEQARRDGLKYFWVDTCCIDKANSSELQEAINSMFSWYRDATKCYVYLRDVSVFDFDENHQLSRKTSLLAFSASRWFTRGWTLQKLIAPRVVQFFSKERCPLGDKKLLEQAIHDITRIPLDALRGDRPLHEFSVDERMSWAKDRNTTRQEDAAYCLMGIFDVHMPLIYGEGRKKALIRLRKETQEVQNLLSVLSKDVRTVSLLSMSENRNFKTFTSSFNDAPIDLLPIDFMERERELGLIRNAHEVSEENAPARCAVWGIPGVGKTQFAIQYTKLFLEDAAVSAVFWMSCSTLEKLHQGFSKLLNLIDHPDQFRPEQNARVVAARRWLEHPEISGIRRWLLVLDNVDISTIDFIRENLPRQGKYNRILITTRTEAVAHTICKSSGKLQLSLELEPPAMESLITFFLKSIGVSENSMSSISRSQVTDLVKFLGCLPFAVEHAASFMTQSSQSIDSFTRLYRGKEKSHILNWRNIFSAYEEKSISGMFTSHLHDLRGSNPEVLGLLNILVFWDPDRIESENIKTGAIFFYSTCEPTKEPSKLEQIRHWTRWFARLLMRILYLVFGLSDRKPATGASNFNLEKTKLPSNDLESLIKLLSSEVQLQGALQQLQMLSFIKRRSADDGGAYCMHELTQTLVQVALESNGTHLQWFRRSVRIVCGAFRQLGDLALPEFWHRCEGLIPHILSLTKYSEVMDPKNVYLLTARAKTAAYWSIRGRYYEARETFQQILAIGSNALNDTSIEMTQWKLGLAEVNWHLGKLSESILLYAEVRQIRELQLGANHPDALHVVEKMALVYRSQGQYAEACSMLEHVLQNRKTSLGPDHLDTIRTIDSLAMVVISLGEHTRAESLYKQALAYRDAQLGAEHLDTLWTADNLQLAIKIKADIRKH